MVAKNVEEKKSNNLFMAKTIMEKGKGSVWLINSGFSCHMIGEKSWFSHLDESKKENVWLANDKEMRVEGVGIVTVNSLNGDHKHLHGV